MKTNHWRRILVILAAVVLCAGITQTQTNVVTLPEGDWEQLSDGTYRQTRILDAATKEITFLNADGSVDSVVQVEQGDGVVTSTMDNGKEVFKTVRDTQTEAFQIFRKPSGAPDSAYTLHIESPGAPGTVPAGDGRDLT